MLPNEDNRNFFDDFRSKLDYEHFKGFLIRHRKPLLVVASVVIILIIIFNMIPVVSINDSKLANLNASIRLGTGQTAILKYTNVSVRIINFTNDACPKGQTCFGNGSKSVEYMIKVGSESFAAGSLNEENTSAYKVKTLSSDYKTYAVIVIVKN